MTYRLDQSVAKIASRILLICNGTEKVYENGKQLADAIFDKNYLIDSISIKESMIVVSLKENDSINDVKWANNSEVSFF